MISGGTSAWPAWGVWLVVAIAFTVVLIVVLASVALGSGFRQPSRGRVLAVVILAATLVSWVGYRVVSNNRWAARAVVAEMLEPLADAGYNQGGSISVETADDSCANGATAWSRATRTDPATSYGEASRDELISELERLEALAQAIEADGYEVTRGTLDPFEIGGHGLHLLATSGGRAALITFSETGARVSATAHACTAAGTTDSFLVRNAAIVDRFDLDRVCAVETEEPLFPGACPVS